jgi:hypothetical protein
VGYNKMESRRAFATVNSGGVGAILEIGALNSPVFSKPDHDAYILDWLDREALIAAYANKQNIRPVDYVAKDKHISACVDRKFEMVIACHVIEHIPDVISWMAEIDQLTTDSGRIVLAVPDKRYTFDIDRQPTETADLLRAFHLDLDKPDIGHLFDHLYRYQVVDAGAIWDGVPHELSSPRFEIRHAYERAKKMASSYNSVHCHIFTTESFVHVFDELWRIGVTPWKIIDLAGVEKPGNEFLVAMAKVFE